MTIDQFLNECESAFGGKQYTIGQRAAFVQKLNRFSDRDIDRIYSEILETCKRLPLIADVYSAAETLGLLTPPERPIHAWTETDCGLCHGEGRLAVIWDLRELNSSIVEVVTQMFQYTKSFDYMLKSNEFRTLYRCRCFAGDALTISIGWPKWSSSINPTRIIQSGSAKRDKDQMRAEFAELCAVAGVARLPHLTPVDVDERIMELNNQARQITEKQ